MIDAALVGGQTQKYEILFSITLIDTTLKRISVTCNFYAAVDKKRFVIESKTFNVAFGINCL